MYGKLGRVSHLFVSLIVGIPFVVQSAVLVVPDEYPQVQAAIDAAGNGDTVLIRPGVYTEALLAPPEMDLTLAGQYLFSGDTTDIAACVLRPPDLFSTQVLQATSFLPPRLLRLAGLTLRGAAYQSSHARGAVSVWDRALVAQHCVFDSCYRRYGSAINAERGSVTLADCRFRELGVQVSGAALNLIDNTAVIERCTFGRVFSHADYVTEIVRLDGCTADFRACLVDDIGWSRAIGECFMEFGPAGANVNFTGCEIRNNRFQHFFTDTDAQVAIGFDSNYVHDNRIQDNLFQTGFVGAGSTARFSGNVFADNAAIPAMGGRMFFLLSTRGVRVEILSNIFLRNSSREYSCISLNNVTSEDVTCERNYFIGNSASAVANPPGGAVVLIGNDTRAFRYNVFMNNSGCAAAHGWGGFPEGAALYNFWGDSSGPYHPVANPFGRGDTIDSYIQFAPWEVDTIFLDIIRGTPAPVPEATRLLSAYPNPFNERTRIRFDLLAPQRVTLALYDLHGRRVRTLADEVCTAGRHERPVDAQGLASGTYFLRLQTAAAAHTQKLLLIR